MPPIDLSTILWATLSGIIPALLWLWFWLHEDKRRPEPRGLIIAAFIGGMLSIIPALFLERFTQGFVSRGLTLIILWATIEECVKYAAAYIVAFRNRCLGGVVCLDEPIDPAIYMITAALGFAAGENALFLLTPLAQSDTLASIITGDLRFLGAMVLHTLASGAIGAAMGLSFYQSRLVKKLSFYIGLFTAITLHVLFNLSIIQGQPYAIFATFSGVWVGVIVLLLVFEKVKTIRQGRRT